MDAKNEGKGPQELPDCQVPTRKPWVAPEITWHKPLQGITLGIQCDTHTPAACPSSMDAPFA